MTGTELEILTPAAKEIPPGAEETARAYFTRDGQPYAFVALVNFGYG